MLLSRTLRIVVEATMIVVCRIVVCPANTMDLRVNISVGLSGTWSFGDDKADRRGPIGLSEGTSPMW